MIRARKQKVLINMGPDKNKKKIVFMSTPHSKDDMILKRFLEQENNDPSKQILSLPEMKWVIDNSKSEYPYGLGKEWEIKFNS